jgi:hypothetical protein
MYSNADKVLLRIPIYRKPALLNGCLLGQQDTKLLLVFERGPLLGYEIFSRDPVPDLHPARMRIPALHRLGLTPADEAKSAGVMNPRDV